MHSYSNAMLLAAKALALGDTTRVQRPGDRRRKIKGLAQARLCLGQIGTQGVVTDLLGNTLAGVNFAAQDYLSLSGHPALLAAAMDALTHHQLLSGGTAAQLGLTIPALTLEARVARLLRLPDAVVFPSGAEANRATLRTLLQRGDHVIVDAGSHPAMAETTLAAGAILLSAPPGSIEGVERRLQRLAATHPRGRVFVTVPTISAHSSVHADLASLVALCREYGATLIADATHDLGAMGAHGGGLIELQGCLGRVDVVTGSFAKSFGASGGFSAFRDPELKYRMRHFRHAQGQSTALSPVNAAVILAAFDIIETAEGQDRRRRLRGHTLRLRNHLLADGIEVMGQTSPLVPIRLPFETAQARTELMERAGTLVTLLEAPVVPRHSPRWRFQLMADHTAADIDELADLIHDVTRLFDRQRRTARQPQLAGQF
jgi:glycine C-acetyltransferase